MTKPTKTPPAGASNVLIVLGTDENDKPRGARFTDANPDLVAKAAKLMDLRVYDALSPELAALAKKLPIGRLYANGRGFVPYVRQRLYSEALELLGERQVAGTGAETEANPSAPGLPKTWDEIAVDHLVVAQESHENGWWESIVLERTDDMLTLRFRDFPKLPTFFRHCSAVALMNPGEPS